jgi:hypothetical protein
MKLSSIMPWLSAGKETILSNQQLKFKNPNRSKPTEVNAKIYGHGRHINRVEFKLPDSGSLIFVPNKYGQWGPNELQFSEQQSEAQKQEATSAAIWIESHLWGKPVGNLASIAKQLEAEILEFPSGLEPLSSHEPGM